MRRVALLALRFNRASKARVALLSVSAAVGMAIFLIVSELSHLSSEDLQASISAEAGRAGTYAIDLGSSLGMDPRRLLHSVDAAVGPYIAGAVRMVEIFPPSPVDCPPGTAFGSLPLLIPYDQTGTPVDGQPTRADVGAPVCIGGQEVPGSAARLPTVAERNLWFGAGSAGSTVGLVLRGRYEPLAMLATTASPSYRFVAVTGQEADLSFQLSDAVTREFQATARRYGMPHVESIVVVTRLDTGQAIRRAAAGVDVVYGVIAWAVLVLAGLGLLIAETIVVRDRMWFFGLSRAVGARGRDIATLVVVDIVLVLAAASALTIVLLLALEPVATSFARNAFQISHVSLLQAAVVPRLILGELLVLAIASAYPTARAVQQDPLDVLEPRVS